MISCFTEFCFQGEIKPFLQCWSRSPRLHSVRPCLPHWCARVGVLERRRVEIWVPMTYETMSGMDEWYTFIYIYIAVNKLCYMDIYIYVYIYIGISGDFDAPNYLNDKGTIFVSISWHTLRPGYLGQLTEDGACHRECGQAGGIISSSGGVGIFGLIWMFPKMVGFTPKSSMFNRVFHYFHHPFWAIPIFGNTHIGGSSCVDISCQVGWRLPPKW